MDSALRESSMASMLLLPKNLTEMLEMAARYSNKTIEFHHANPEIPTTVMTISQLWERAQANASFLHGLKNIRDDSIVLIHFDDYQQNVIWLWATIVAGYLPAMSPAFVNDKAGRYDHILHLNTLFNEPIILTAEHLVEEFLGIKGLNIHPVDSFDPEANLDPETTFDPETDPAPMTKRCSTGYAKNPEDPAVLMLTSGSTGHAKGVVLRHKQIKAALAGKVAHHGTNRDDVFLSWVALDHVASLCQVHLHALALGARQILVNKNDVSNDANFFLRLIHNNRVSVTFGPNFYLARISLALDKMQPLSRLRTGLDLSCLKVILSGGEANALHVCVTATRYLRKLGAKGSPVSPGFGMTETCAGCTHNLRSPEYDLETDAEFASVGPCIPGVSARVVDDDGMVIRRDSTPGLLQLKGDVVFQGYYNNAKATNEAFTEDGWFITGDKALIDANGYVQLSGRSKELIIVNGVNYYPYELVKAIDEAKIPHVEPNSTVVFAHRPEGALTEKVVIVYAPNHPLDVAKSLVEASDAISNITARLFGVSPYQIVPIEKELIPKSTLGKTLHSRVAASYRAGRYDNHYRLASEHIRNYRIQNLKRPETETELAIAGVYSKQFGTPLEKIGVESSILDMGVSSLELIGFKTQVQEALGMTVEIPLISVLANPTIQGIAQATEQMQRPREYNPVVTLNATGDKTPLWLVHPGVGEVLVFLNLAKHIKDRPLHALRARGFEEGEEYFQDLPEIFETYYKHIKLTQPTGPYAIAGYSFGAMIGFEVAKILESNGDEVKFVGSFNLPPHIRERMHQLDWIEAGINLSYFLELITEEYAHEISPAMHRLSHSEVLDHIFSCAPPGRLQELSLTKEKMNNWISLAHKMQEAALEYEPSGSVVCIDVFHAIPLKLVAKDRTDWVENKLSKWADFSRTQPQMHQVDGAHYTMMAPEHIVSFQKILRNALAERGL
ncbi:putative NRPS-like protein biosynthetic cluster [Arachnomyces sp. PD_36]|nr:putative NRPS-like protein biosynthetic cluster [Arachnomyces sp. PD_36]